MGRTIVTSYCASSCYQASVILLPTVNTSQQDRNSAPVHTVRATIELLCGEVPGFIALTVVWPPKSLDLNPVDYRIWAVLQERVHQQPV